MPWSAKVTRLLITWEKLPSVNWQTELNKEYLGAMCIVGFFSSLFYWKFSYLGGNQVVKAG